MPLHSEVSAKSEEITRIFNAEPKKGINLLQALCATHSIENPEEQIALFFKANKSSLDLEAVGDFLGTGGNEKTLQHFTSQIDLSGKSFVEGMREYLKEFKLPGEAQKIDRITESFAARYVGQNPDKIRNKDTAYTLAFSAIMLNTDAHNPSIKPERKMTLDQFIRNNRGIDQGQDVDRAFLKEIYNDIKSKPFELNFVKTPPGITIEPSAKDLTQTLTNLKEKYGDGFTKSKPKSIWAKLFGHKNTVTISQEEGRLAIKMDIYEPGWFSLNKPTVNIQTAEDIHEKKAKTADQHKAALDLAVDVAATFQTHVKSITASFDYQKKDIEEALRAKGKPIGKFTAMVLASQQPRQKAGMAR